MILRYRYEPRRRTDRRSRCTVYRISSTAADERFFPRVSYSDTRKRHCAVLAGTTPMCVPILCIFRWKNLRSFMVSAFYAAHNVVLLTFHAADLLCRKNIDSTTTTTTTTQMVLRWTRFQYLTRVRTRYSKVPVENPEIIIFWPYAETIYTIHTGSWEMNVKR